jgi:predicted dehydrogenase
MLLKENLDAVFIIVGNDHRGRPMYPAVAVDCLNAGCHAWIEKPPAATCSDIERMMEASNRTGKKVMIGYKKMFVQANMKAKELALAEDFGGISMVTFQNPEFIPTVEQLHQYMVEEQNVAQVSAFLEHLCHPVAQMLSLLGAPISMMYDRNSIGAGVIIFKFDSDVIASINLTAGMALNGGVERTLIISRGDVLDGGGRTAAGRHIVVDNNLKVSYYRNADYGYGDEPNFYIGTPDQNTAVWEPEFSRGQLFNKGLFLLGYYEEMNEFARSILEDRELKDGTLKQAWHATRIFEKFIEGPGKVIPLEVHS